MDFKVLTSIPSLPGPRLGKQNFFVIGTHNGIFHSDEVVAIAILYLLHKDENIIVVRTRDIETLKKCTLCVDIGGGQSEPNFEEHFSNVLDITIKILEQKIIQAIGNASANETITKINTSLPQPYSKKDSIYFVKTK